MDDRAHVRLWVARAQLLITVVIGVAVVISSLAQGAGSDLPTSKQTLAAGDMAIFVAHDSSNTQVVGDGGSIDKHRIIRWASDGRYASRRTYGIFGFRLISGAPGRMYDFHTQPLDVGGWDPPCSGGGVAPLAIDYWGDARGLEMVAEPENSGCSGGSGNYHFRIFSQSEVEARRGQWVWLWAEITWGRRDIGTKGALKVWVAGEDQPRVDMSGINTHWGGEQMVTFWEGAYVNSGSSSRAELEIAATRFGRTPQEAYDDSPVRFGSLATNAPNSSSAVVASRSSSDAAMPSALGSGPAPTPAPAPAPAPAPPAPAPAPAAAPPNFKLHVKKVVVGGSVSPSAFSFSVSGGGGTHAFDADGNNELTLPAGTYTVTEPPASGWTTTYAGCSNIVLASGQAAVPTCTVTNTKQQSAPPPPPPPPPPAPAPVPLPHPVPVVPVPVPAPVPPAPSDASAPTAPGRPRAVDASQATLTVAWRASTDNVGVKGYGVYLRGDLVETVTSSSTTLANLDCGVGYSLAVDAFDSAGNHSDKAPVGGARTAACQPERQQPEETDPNKSKPDKENVHPKAPTRPERWLPWWLWALPTAVSTWETGAPANPRPSVVLLDGRKAKPAARPVDADRSSWFASLFVAPGSSPSATGLQFDIARASHVDWDRRRFYSRGALRLHLQWSGASWTTWVRQHPGAALRLPR